MELTVRKRVTYSIGHRLESFEHCARNHGHNYTVELWARASIPQPLAWEDGLPEGHMTVDFGSMKEHIQQVVGFLDQWNMNEAYNEPNPTAEWAALRWLRQLHALDSRYFKLTLEESDNSIVEVTI